MLYLNIQSSIDQSFSTFLGTKRDVKSLNGIDGKILTLQKEMNTSLIGVEENLRKVAGHLFNMLGDSLKSLVDDPKSKIGTSSCFCVMPQMKWAVY